MFSSLPTYFETLDFVVFADFDETYMPCDPTVFQKSGIGELEAVIRSNASYANMLLGWVTGSSLEIIKRKIDQRVILPPDFISTNLGTELYWSVNSEFVEDLSWGVFVEMKKNIKELFTSFEEQARIMRINLELQPEQFQGKRIRGYYLERSTNEQRKITIVRVGKNKS